MGRLKKDERGAADVALILLIVIALLTLLIFLVEFRIITPGR